jgi:hypothetical protein
VDLVLRAARDSARSSGPVASPHSSDPVVKIAVPTANVARRPNRFLAMSGPPNVRFGSRSLGEVPDDLGEHGCWSSEMSA